MDVRYAVKRESEIVRCHGPAEFVDPSQIEINR